MSSGSVGSLGRSGTPTSGGGGGGANNNNIQIILEAERSAKAIIEEARAYRQARVKQARQAALEEVSALKQRLDAEYLEYEGRVKGEMEQALRELEEQEARELERVKADVEQGWDEAKRIITDSVLKFD